MDKLNTITKNSMQIDCYGQWCEDSNCLIVGDLADGSELDEFWTGERSYNSQPCVNWTEVVTHLSAWAKDNGYMIYELTAC